MPSHGLIRQFDDLFQVEDEWRWNGTHYAKTAMDWLSLYDHNDDAIEPILRDVYGADWYLWKRRWRMFFLATAGLFGFESGNAWGVSHYRLRAT
jgi:cyclopropane-fatty-acyl-phospholipid synthase